MNIKSVFQTGLAAFTIAAAPLTVAARNAAETSANNPIRTEKSIVKEGENYISTIRKTNENTGTCCEIRFTSTDKPSDYRAFGEPRGQEGVFRVGVDYSSQEILGQRTHEPRMNAQLDARAENFCVRPNVTVGTESYNAVLPIDFQLNTGKNTFIEIGSDLAGVRGFHNGKKAFLKSSVDKVNSGENCKADAYSGEFFRNFHIGGRFKNDVVNASVRGEAGRTAYIGGFVNEAPGYSASQIESSSYRIINKKPNYVGARANVEVMPLKNKNIAITAEGAVFTNKGPEASVGIGYTF